MSESKQEVAAPIAQEVRAIGTQTFRTKKAIANAIAKTENDGRTALGQVFGAVMGYNEKVTNQKDGTVSKSYQFLGQFEAVSFETGEIIKSGMCYLPSYFADTIRAYIERLSKSGSAAGLEFAIEIGMEPNPRSKEGEGVAYQYYVKNLIPPAQNDPLEALKRRVPKAVLKLPIYDHLALEHDPAAEAGAVAETGAAETGAGATQAPAGKLGKK